MKNIKGNLFILVFTCFFATSANSQELLQGAYLFQPVPFTQVKIEDQFRVSFNGTNGKIDTWVQSSNCTSDVD